MPSQPSQQSVSDLENLLLHGTLSQLSTLAQQAQSLIQVQKHRSRASDDVMALREELARCISERDRLKQHCDTLASLQTRVPEQLLSKAKDDAAALLSNVKPGLPVLVADPSLESGVRVLAASSHQEQNTIPPFSQFLQRARKEDRATGYRLCGQSLLSVSKKDPFHGKPTVAIRFDTATQGRYQTTHTVWLSINDTKKLYVARHSLPFFIPVHMLAARYLPKDQVQTFIDILDRHLQAFVVRRDAVAAWQSEASLNNLQSTLAVHRVQAEMTLNEKVWNVYLIWDQIDQITPSPSRVLIHSGKLYFCQILSDGLVGNQQDRWVELEALFKSLSPLAVWRRVANELSLLTNINNSDNSNEDENI